MESIKIPARVSDNFGDPISKFLDILSIINTLGYQTPKQFDFSDCKFFNPFLLAGLASLYQTNLSNRDEIEIIPPSSNSIHEYLSTICFPSGFNYNPHEVEKFQTLLTPYHVKNYIPLIFFPATNTGNNSDVREKILSAVNSILKAQLNLGGGVLQAIYYMIDELTQNITDHSKCNNGIIFAQYYPSKNYMDICIVDNGIGLLQGYINSGKYEVATDEDAVNLAVRGKSTKDLPESRGFGLSTSRKMLVEGLKGKFLLFSGSAMFIQTIEKEEIACFEANFKFKGCYVALRIPTFNNKEFDFYKYIE